MNEALESFAEVDQVNKLAILGDMLELGNISEKEHQRIVDFLEKNQITAILVGKEFMKTKQHFPAYQSCEELIEKENPKLINDHLILLKGSRGIKLEQLIPLL